MLNNSIHLDSASNEAIAAYHNIFNIPLHFDYCRNALLRYYNTNEVTILFHTDGDMYTNDIEITEVYTQRLLLTSSYKAMVAKQYADLPSVTNINNTWFDRYNYNEQQCELITKCCSIGYLRWIKRLHQGLAFSDVEPPMVIELQVLLNLIPNASIIAVKLGDCVENTILNTVDNLMIIADNTRGYVLN